MMVMSLHMNAQTLAKNYKSMGEGNPISANIFCADPTALEYKGRLYVYGSNDHQQFIANGKTGSNNYGSIQSLVVFSTDDMVNWTFHGTIDVKKVCPWSGNSWAPSVTWRTRTHGTHSSDEFFIYFANGASNVGVMKGTSPIGPFHSPLTKAMIDGGSPGVSPCKWCFDPGVVIDENGTGWISFGGGGRNDNSSLSTNLQPNNACIAKLKPNMFELDGAAVKIPAPYHFEANELNVMDGKYVYTYCTHFGDYDQWETYEKRGNYSKPGKGLMCYMVGDDPLHPENWEYKGVYGPHPGTSGNNHTHLQKFQGEYYHIYHSGALLEAMKSAKAVNAGDFRSICVNKATVNEGTQTVNMVTLDLTGVNAIKKLNPYELQQAETMANCGGVEYEDFVNVKKNTEISTLGNDASINLYVKMADNAWTYVRNIDFGANGPKSFILTAKGKGTLELRKGKAGKALASFDFSSTDFEDHVFAVDPETFKDVSNLFFAFRSVEDAQFDAWQFSEQDPSGISSVHQSTATATQRFDLSGRQLNDNATHRGIVIEQYKDANGKTHSRKRVQ